MKKSHEFNLQLAASQDGVDRLNKEFYGRFTFPWPPMTFETFPERFGADMLHQDIGCWDRDRLPPRPKIWVAGCGTNQAVITALKFPEAEILGTDISTQSLATCRCSAEQLGLDNLTLEERSLNAVDYDAAFDLVICTGVIHHNADPGVPLRKLAAALKPDGVLELMVYNFYHRFMTTAYQKAIRLLCGAGVADAVDFEAELGVTRKLTEDFPADNLMASYLARAKGAHEAQVADMLLQPVEHSYTVETLEELAADAGLELLLPCVNAFDKAEGRLDWGLRFADAEIAGRYQALGDSRRWQVTNLLLLNDSPMLWFYLQRRDSGHRRKSEREICDDLLTRRVEKLVGERQVFRRTGDGSYRLLPRRVPFPTPAAPADELSRRLFDAADGETPMGEIFRRLGLETSFDEVNRARVHLTTTTFPYLRAVDAA